MNDSQEKSELYVWPDGTWCYVDEINEFGHMSDDYAKVICDIGLEEEAVQAFIRA